MIIAKAKRAGEALSFAEKNWHGKREAALDCVKSSRGASFAIGGKGGRSVNARFSHSKEAGAAEEGSLRVVILREEGDKGEELGERARARGDLAVKERGEELGLKGREGDKEPRLKPWELLSAVAAVSEGEAEAKRAPIAKSH